MNSLLLFLLLGASVTLAELPFDHPALVGFLNEEGEELFGAELADEENDPDNELVNFFLSHCYVLSLFNTISFAVNLNQMF